MPLEFGHLQESSKKLAEVLDCSTDTEQMEKLGPDVEMAIRLAVIYHFEATYRLAVKMIRRQLSEIVANPSELNGMSFASLMRDAARAGLIHDPAAYMCYKDLMNKTPYTFDPELTLQIVSVMPKFLDSVRFLMEELMRRNS